MALDQATRLLGLKTPLGDNQLLLTAFEGREAISQLFEFKLQMISDNASISPADIVGKNVTFRVKLADDSPRFFNGFVSRFGAGDEDDGGRRNYVASVVPWLWFLTRTSDCRIFQNKSVPVIIAQVFGDYGFSDFELNLSGTHPTREYCVQYRETDFNFVSRLMEEEGIYYFFQHQDGKHTLTISDNKRNYVACKESEVDYPRDYGTRALKDHLTSWEHEYQFRTGKFAQTDYNFQTPSTQLMTNSKTVVSLPGVDKFEFYDYPGEYGNKSDGSKLTDIRMEEEEAPYDVVHGTSLCKSFTSGGVFSVKKHRASSEEGKKYVLTMIKHHATEPLAYETGASEGPEYVNEFTCIPESVTFRPPRTARRPFVQGVQTAVVTGPAGEEIYTDEYGRVKVQFFWDREGREDENSSCWMRVAQNWAGQNWGMIFNPRIGQEVIVDFVEGHPDRPIIVGRVYNAEQMPPYPLPANQTQSGIKSRSSKGGGSDNFNEIRFEDKLGQEEMYLHAEKDQNTVVENDQTITVGHDRTERIGRDRTLIVDRDKAETVARDKSINVGASHTETIGTNMSINVGANLTETVALNYAETVGVAMELTVGAALAISVGAAMSQTVGGTMNEAVGGSRSATVGGSKSTSVGGDVSETIGKNQTIRVANDVDENVGGKCKLAIQKDYLVKAKKIQVVADDEIAFTTGSAQIVMKKNGDIIIKGKQITVKGSSDVVIKGKNILEN